MFSNLKTIKYWLSTLCLLGNITVAAVAQAQTITPALDGTGTIVQPQGSRIDISGGTLSGDNANLFHSFSQFGLSSAQIANFLSNPNIKNILGRVTGGDASIINGLIQVTGGNSNLFLINPAGIIFGTGAQLNVPGSFTASTATGIGFNGYWFNSIGPNNYSNLVGNPTAFRFDTNQAAAIINAGNLTVKEGQSLALIGGTVINTGTLTAPSGNINLMAVPGTNLVRLSQAGQILSLEVAPPIDSQNNILPFTPKQLPELLTSSNVATGLTVNADNTVQNASGNIVPTQVGTTIASGSINAFGTTGGKVNIFGEKVGLIKANINVAGTNSGGTALIGGDYQGLGTVPNAKDTFVSNDSTINADALSIGNGGKVIIWADNTTRFYGNISARGGLTSGNGGFAEVSGKQKLDFQGFVNLQANAGQVGTLLLDPTDITISNDPDDTNINDSTINVNTLQTQLGSSNVIVSTASGSGGYALGDIKVNAPISWTSNNSLTLVANNDILIDADITAGGNLTLQADNSIIIGVTAPVAIAAASSPINITLRSDSDASNAGAIKLTNSSINSSNGNIILGGGFDPSTDPARATIQLDLRAGVTLDNSSINAGTGNISIRGQGEDDYAESPGILIEKSSSISTTGNGAISLTGTGGNSTVVNRSDQNSGIKIDKSTVTTANGNINIKGEASSIGELNHGITIWNGGVVQSTGSGTITLDGTTTATGFNNDGISIGEIGSKVQSTDGNIILTGTSGTGAGSQDGIAIFDSGKVTSQNGNISFIGNARGSGDDNNGIILIDGGAVETTGTGNILLDGKSTVTSTQSWGIKIGTVGVNGGDVGVQTTGSGSISIEGSAIGSIDPDNPNVAVGIYGRTVQALGTGSLNFIGKGNFSGFTLGVDNGDNALISAFNGNINYSAIANGYAAISIRDGAKVQTTGTGNIDLTGTNIGTGSQASGVSITTLFSRNNGVLEAIGNGNINLTGTGSNGSEGISLVNGSINPTGTGSGNVTLKADEIYFAGTTQIKGNGILELQPLTSSLGITIGGTIDDSRLNLDSSELAFISNGFSQIYIGRADSSGTISLGSDVTFNDPVTLRSPATSGAINTTGFTITGNDNATINLLANQNITTGNITNSGRAINITSTSGNVDTTGGILSTTASGDAGAIALSAFGNINTGNINTISSNSGNAANITLNSTQGSINTLGLYALTDFSNNLGNGGIISVTANLGNITTGTIDASVRSSGSSKNAGQVILKSQGNINTTGNIWAANNGSGNAGIISLTATQGAINTSAGNLNAFAGGNGGTISLTALNNVTTANANSSSSNGSGGYISLTTQTGTVTSGNLTANGAIAGGAVTVIAIDSIKTGQINTSASIGNGGNVTLDPLNDIVVELINAQGGTSGTGGIVDITTQRLFRTTNTFTDNNGQLASISTAGSTGSGAITIRHGGGPLAIPFIVGDATTNGTAGAISSSLSNTISPVQSFPGSYTQGNIQIITQYQTTPTTTTTQTTPTTTTTQTTPTTTTTQTTPTTTTTQTTPTTTTTQTTPISTPTTTSINIPIEISSELTRAKKASSEPSFDANTSLSLELDTVLAELDAKITDTFTQYLGENLVQNPKNITETRETLQEIESATGVKPALIYVLFTPSIVAEKNIGATEQLINKLSSDQEQLEIIVITSKGKPIRHRVSAATRSSVMKVVQEFTNNVVNPRKHTAFLAPSQKLYKWMLAPIEADLKAQGIQNLVFIMDKGLRSLPIAALHDGSQFLVEKYSVGLMPSLSLTDTRYVDIKNARLLGMGANKFSQLSPLPAVPLELEIITQKIWGGKSFLNEKFTLNNLKAQRHSEPASILHLATHGKFQPGVAKKSFIQLWDTRLEIGQFRQLKLNEPPIELFVLSACQTALGDTESELGFAGLAVTAGVKTALGSLWYISDLGTMGFMIGFYEELKKAPIKAEALRRAQVAMLKGEVRLQGGKLHTAYGDFPLTPELKNSGDGDLSHPYYWSAFTMIGNPW